MNMLQVLSTRYHFNDIDTTKLKIKNILSSFWNEKANDHYTPKALKKKAKNLHSTIDVVLGSRPAVSIINSNIKKVLFKQLSLIFSQCNTNNLSLSLFL